jgi:DNA modification methylase
MESPVGKHDTPQERKAQPRGQRRGARRQAPHPNTIACVDCGHRHLEPGDRRHEYDHTGDYNDEGMWTKVESVCTDCHHKRTAARTQQVALQEATARLIKKQPAGSTLRIEYQALAGITSAVRNVKDHDIAEIIVSIRRFGFGDAVIVDERTGRLISGHGRVEALRVMFKADSEHPPLGIGTHTKDGVLEWIIPVQRGWASVDDVEAEAFLVACNRLVERGGWEQENLAAVLADLAKADALEGTGYERHDVDRLLNEINAKAKGHTEPDDLPDVDDAGDVKPGDLFELGAHLLLCGDSTDPAVVDRLLAGVAPDMMWSDPPYGVDYESAAGKVHNDSRDGLEKLLAGFFAQAFRVLPPGAFIYVAHPAGANSLVFTDTLRAAGFTYKQGLVWEKDSLVLGHSDYHYEHEPIIYAMKPALKGRRGRGGTGWYGDNSQVSVFRVPKPKRSDDHPTMKPVALIEPMLINSSAPGQVVFEPFNGSGSTLIACERLQRRCRAIELSPVYVNRTIARWEAFTQRKVKKL